MIQKGQVSLEFLMTYGIAILAIVAAIGLAYSQGIFQPCRFTGSFASGFSFNALITNPKLDTNQNLSFSLKATGADVGIVAMDGTYEGHSLMTPSTISTKLNPAQRPRRGPRSTITLGFNGTIVRSGMTEVLNLVSAKPVTGLSVGSCYTAKLNIIYNLSSDTVPTNHSMTVTIAGPIQS